MKSVRLLPVVIFAALALLVFKGIGLVTNGGYVLTGPQVALAAETTPAAPAANDTPMAMPAETTMTDTSPMLTDTAPTLAAKPEAGGHGETVTRPSGGETTPAADAPAATPSADVATAACPVASAETAPAADTAPAAAAAPAAGDHAAAPADAAPAVVGCPEGSIGVDQNGDALPSTKDADGNLVPLSATDGTGNSEEALLARLGERRTELDQRETELNMRFALVEAAEKRIDQKTADLKALEERINALVEEKKTAEDGQFKSVVSMYETMKPKDAAQIFDQLDMGVLIRVASSMSPRKMGPIMAAMDPTRAQALTTNMAAVQGPTSIDVPGENLAQLPQIVGQ